MLVLVIGAGSCAKAQSATTDERLLSQIQKNIDDPWPGITDPNNAAGVFSYALACLYLNQNVSQANQLLFNFYTNNPIPPKGGGRDEWNGYFWQHIVWRLFHDPAAGSRLTTQTRELIEDNMWVWLDTRSKIAEAEQSEWLIYDSENHDAMTKASHVMCLLALKNSPRYGPDAVLSDGGTITQHLDAWTAFYMRYFRARAREGINVEIACQQYARYTVGAYYNIMDFADSPSLRQLVKTFIDLYWADTTSDWLSTGVRGGAQTRCYREGTYLRNGSSYSFHGLTWAYGWHQNEADIRTYPLIQAISPYRIPEIITACATDPNRPNFLYTSRRFGRGGGWDSNTNYPVVFDNGDSSIRRETYVTPDYSIGSFTLDMNKDYIALIDQNRIMGVTFAAGFNERIMIFGKGGTDPTKSFADINGVTRANCMVVQRDKNAYSSGIATQMYVSPQAWANRVEVNGWLFTQLGNAYCAIKPANGGYTSEVAGSGMNLTLDDLWAPVVFQMGQAADYADFADFQAAIQANAFTYPSSTLNYTSEAGDTFTFYANTKTTPKVNGATVDLNPAKTYDSPYLSMVHGENTATFRYAGYPDRVLDFLLSPQLLQRSPVDNAAGVSMAANLTMNFDQTIARGAGLIHLRNASTGQTIETFDAATSSRLSYSGSQLVVDPADDLRSQSSYEMIMPAGAVVGLTGKPFAGLANSGDWNFTTASSDPVVLGTVERTDADTTDALHTISGYSVPSSSGQKLILVASWENASSVVTATWMGSQNFTTAVNSGGGRNAAILYLDNPAAGTGDIVLTFGAATASRLGVLRVSGLANGVSITSSAIGPSGSLTTTVANSLVVGVHSNNGTVLMTHPFANNLMRGDSGSSTGCAGYGFQASAAQQTYAWTGTNANDNHSLTAFVPSPENLFANWISSYPSLAGASGAQDDPDGDSISNGLENLLGTTPEGFSKAIGIIAAGNGLIELEHTRNNNPATDLSIRYRWSTDLLNFHDDGATNSEGAQVDFAVFKNVPTSGRTLVRAVASGAQAGRLFVVLQAVRE